MNLVIITDMGVEPRKWRLLYYEPCTHIQNLGLD